ncbi:MAG: hypothetical protein LBQ49_00025 [Rickettsiales bacterium]|jgi:hypothetical protein|nr:hypothetical protein [Rickettsiales bacterium]
MKKITNIAVISIAAFGLGACGGGGGGAAPYTDFPNINFVDGALSPVSGAGSIMSYGEDDNATVQRKYSNIGTSSSNKNGINESLYAVEKTSEGIVLRNRGEVVNAEDIVIKFSTDFREGNNTMIGLKNTGDTQTDVVVLGGKKTGLQYSDFGIWKSADNGISFGDAYLRETFAFYTGGYQNGKPAPTSATTFTGKVVGTAYNSAGTVYKDVVGTASIEFTRTGGQLTAATEFDFDNFYKFAFTRTGVTTDQTYGDFWSSLATTPVTVTGSPSNPEVTFNTGTYMTQIGGQFYGNEAASEAVGTFSMNAGSGIGMGTNGIVGAFGVKAP